MVSLHTLYLVLIRKCRAERNILFIRTLRKSPYVRTLFTGICHKILKLVRQRNPKKDENSAWNRRHVFTLPLPPQVGDVTCIQEMEWKFKSLSVEMWKEFELNYSPKTLLKQNREADKTFFKKKNPAEE